MQPSTEAYCHGKSEHGIQYRALCRAISEGYVLLEILADAEGLPVDLRIVDVNPAYERLTGRDRECVVGRTVREILPGRDGVWLQRYSQVVSTGRSDRFIEYCRETGCWCDVLLFCPETDRLAAVYTDITAEKRLEERVGLTRHLEAIGSLAGGVANDFNNLLTVIMGAGSMLRMKLESSRELLPFVEQILVSSERAAKLSQNLLAFSRSRSMNMQPVDINEVVMTLKEFIQRLVGENIIVDVSCCREPLTVRAERCRLEQVLVDLVVHARESMPAGGLLQIATAVSDRESQPADLQFGRRNVYARVTVSDSGLGMGPDRIQRLFQPLQLSREKDGTGLGLSMAYGTIRRHEGTITVQSEPASGTTFTVFLPLAGNGDSTDPGYAGCAAGGGEETILIVDDVPEVRDTNRLLLEYAGYNIITAGSGLEAIDLFKRYGEGISLVILDVNLPDMNGREVSDVLRILNQDVRVLFVSGYSAESLVMRGMIPDGTALLPKAMESSQFLTRVNELLRGGSA